MNKYIIKITSDKCYGVNKKSAMGIQGKVLQIQGKCSNENDIQFQSGRNGEEGWGKVKTKK